MAPPPPVLMDELLEEVLFRLPPDDARSLVRAALVCKRWRRLVSAPGFRRRFSAFHGAPPPLQGVLYTVYTGRFGFAHARFVPASPSSFRPPRSCDRVDRHVLDARHGRVLLRGPKQLFVWDPITDGVDLLPKPPAAASTKFRKIAVLCAGTLGGACGHLDCHRRPYLVVYVACNEKKMVAYIYSSEARAWSQPTTYSPDHPRRCPRFTSALPSVVLENALHLHYVDTTDHVVKYDLLSRAFSVFGLPRVSTEANMASAVLTTTEDGRLGFARAEDSKLFLWSRDAAIEENFGWAVTRVIDLATLLPTRAISEKLYMAAFAYGAGVLVCTEDGLFAIEPKSDSVRKVGERNGGGYGNVYPYMSFYTPVLGMACTSDGGTAGASCT